MLSPLRKVYIQKKFWAKALLFSALPYPNLKVGVIDTQVINGLQSKNCSFLRDLNAQCSMLNEK
jgi:hypothetical protein